MDPRQVAVILIDRVSRGCYHCQVIRARQAVEIRHREATSLITNGD